MEGAPPNALSRSLENYGLPPVELQKGCFPLKPKVPEEELTHVQKMQRACDEIKLEKRREGGLWDPNVYGGGILQVGSAIRCYMLGKISHHKGPSDKYLGVADLQWLVKMLEALKDTDGYPRCNLSGIRFTWNREGEWPFSLNRIDTKDPSHGETNVELIVALCNAVERESHGAWDLRTSFTVMFKQMLREFTEPTLERQKDEDDVIARVEEVFGADLERRKRIYSNILKALENDATRNGWTDAHRKVFKGLFGGYTGLLCSETKKKFILQRGRCAYTGILMNGSLTSPFCVSLERRNNEICHFPLKLDELGQPTVDFSNVVWIVRLIQVQKGWSRRTPTLEPSREQEKLIRDALSAAVA